MSSFPFEAAHPAFRRCELGKSETPHGVPYRRLVSLILNQADDTLPLK
jgi:hypothetical protein